MKLDSEIPDVPERVAERLPAVVVDTLREQWSGLAKLDEQVVQIERRMHEWKKNDKNVKAICEIAGVGQSTATAAVAAKGNAKHSSPAGSLLRGLESFRSRRVRAAR